MIQNDPQWPRRKTPTHTGTPNFAEITSFELGGGGAGEGCGGGFHPGGKAHCTLRVNVYSGLLRADWLMAWRRRTRSTHAKLFDHG
jgi:hypothetical protein